MNSEEALQANIANLILLIRGHRVMLDSDLAKMYGVTTKQLNQQVKRNWERFPQDFVFRLTQEETNRSQIVTGSQRHRDPRYLPYVFTEHGALMLASVLHSKQAVEMSLSIVRVFIKLREMLSAHKELNLQLGKLEQKIEKHDEEIRTLFEAIRQLIAVPEKPKYKIGFHSVPQKNFSGEKKGKT